MNKDHFAELCKGVATWNAWRTSNPAIIPDLSGQDLAAAFPAGAEVAGLNLQGANLRGATFPPRVYRELDVSGAQAANVVFKEMTTLEALRDSPQTDFDEASFAECVVNRTHFSAQKFSKANFFKATLQDVTFSESRTLTGAKFNRSKLERVTARTVTFVDSPFNGANISHGDFEGSTFKGSPADSAILENVCFAHVALRHCGFCDASIRNASFSDCDLRDVKGLQFDETLLQRTILSAAASDQWTTLRRRYTGTSMVFTLLALLAFFIPFAMSGIYWVSVAQMERRIGEFSEEIIASPATPEPLRQLVLASSLNTHLQAIRSCGPGESSSVPANGRCLTVLQLLLGHQGGKVLFATGIALLLYNIVRGVLTWRVGALSDVQSDTFQTPGRSSYRWLYVLHLTVSVLFFLSVGLALFSGFETLSTKVWLPAV